MSIAAQVPKRADAPPPAAGDARASLAFRYLGGRGLEIGALHLALPLPPGAEVRYVDRMGVGDLRHHYPELAALDLAPVDVVDDGERLETVTPESVDFIVANHFLEHCQDPIATITTHLTKLRPGGILLYAVPDKRYTFDFRRDRTPLQHIIDDHEHGAQRSRAEHYLQWASHVHEGTGPPSAEQAQAYAHQLEAEDYSIHFHVWTAADLTELMLHIQQRLDNFEIETIRRNGIENIVILRKTGELALAPPPLLDLRDADPVRTTSSPRVLSAWRTPVAGLRAQLDADQAVCEWSIDPDGISGRGLLMPTGRRIVFPLRLAVPTRFTAQVRLLPHDWRDGQGVVDARVRFTDAAGEHEAWAGAVCAGEPGGELDGLAVDCELPAGATSLRLVLAPHRPGIRAVARAVWVEPALIGPDGAMEATSQLTPSQHVDKPSAGKGGGRAPGRPLISVLTPVHDPSPRMLREAVESVRGQTFEDWELCLVDDGSRDPEIIAMLRGYAEGNPRIRLTRREQGGGIADATNAALALASGEYVALLDHDDWLGPDALGAVAARIAADPGLDMLYTDEDIVLEDTPVWVHVKPGWSPDTMRTNGYTCHLGVYRRLLLQEIGGLRSRFDGSQDVDMILRLMELTDRVAHVPGVHYHWRIHPDSTAGGDAKPYAYVAARDAIAEHLGREQIDASVYFGPPGLYRVVHAVPETARAALVLAVEDAAGVRDAARTWVSQSHRAWHVVLAGPEPVLREAMSELRAAGVANHRIRTCVCDGVDRHVALARAARTAEAEELVLMQTPAAGLTDDWLTRLLGYARQPGIGAAGPVQLGSNGRVQEGGLAFPDGWPQPLLHGTQTSMNDHFGYGTSVYNVSAVAGMLATSSEIFAASDGLRPEHAELSLVDYCLRLGDSGRRVVIVPDARLQITGHDRTMNDLPRLARIAGERIEAGWRDPYANPLVRPDRGDFCWR